MQTIVPLEDGSAIRVTTALYYLPSGRNLHRKEGAQSWGVDPNDGYYVPMTFEQVREMYKVRGESDVLRKENGQNNEEKITPQWIKTKLSDPQLAAAYETLLARLETGQFKPVGQANATLLAHQTEKANLEKTREKLTESLAEINKRIGELEKAGNGATAQPAKPADPQK